MQTFNASKIRAGLIRVASKLPESNPYRAIFAAFALAAGAQEDMYARACYIEGVLGLKSNTMSRAPRVPFAKATEALMTGQPNPIAEALQARGFPVAEALKMVSPMDQGLLKALVSGAKEGMKGQSSVRGHTAEDIVFSVLMGMSPATGEVYGQYGGQGVLQWQAKHYPKQNSLKSILNIAARNMAFHALGILRRNKSEKNAPTTSLNAPMGEDSTDTFLDALSDTAGPSLFSSVLQLEETLELIAPIVQESLRNDRQRLIWEAFKAQPEVLTYDGEIGVNGPLLAKKMAEISGEPYTGRSQDVMARRDFMNVVLPAMLDALKEQDVAKELLRHSEVMDLIREEMQPRMASTNRQANLKLVRAALKEMLNLV